MTLASTRRRGVSFFALVSGLALALPEANAQASPGGPAPLICADGFESGDTRAWHPCLPPGSSIQPLSPGHPLPLGGDPEHEIFNNVEDALVATGGSFTYGPEPVSPPPPFTCQIDGAPAVDCTDLAYDLGSLAEGGHVLWITGNECCGSSVQETLTFFVDSNPPQLSPPDVFLDHQTGSAFVGLTAVDAITNIETVDCLLDFDANGTNPDILAADGDPGNDGDALFVPCSALDGGFGSLPTRPPGDEATPRVPRSFTGTLALGELAAGRHRLWYRATDFWGHASATSAVDFMMDYGDAATGRFGHVVAIGHDFEELGDSAWRMLGNSALLSAARDFARDLRILGLDLGGVDLEGTPKANVQLALLERFAEVGESGFAYSEWSGDPGAFDLGVTAHLLGKDVLLLYDQNDPAISASIGSNAGWLDALRTFVTAGGVVIVLDGVAPGGGLSETIRIVGNAEPWNQPSPPPGADPLDEDVNLLDSGAVEAFDSPSAVELVCRSDSPIRNDVGDPGIEPRIYGAFHYTVLLLQDPVANEIFVAPQSGVYRPVVMDRLFPLRTGQGPVRLRAWGDLVPRGPYAFALFSAPNGAVEGICRLRPDGGAAHDVSAGGTVTVASANDVPVPGSAEGGGKPFGGSLDLESVHGVELWETIDVGRAVPWPLEIPGGIEVEIPRYPDLVTAAAVDYYVTNGCARVTAGQSLVGLNPILTIGATATDECLTGSGQMSFLAEVRDAATGEVLAYASLAGYPRETGIDCHGNPFFDGWCVDVGDWPIVSTQPNTQWAAPQSPRLTVTYAGAPFSPAPHLEAAQVLLRHAATAVGFEEGLGLNPASELYFASKIPNAFADALRLHGLVYTALVDGSGPFSLSAYARDLALGPAGLATTDQLLPRAAFLPRILGVAVDDSVPESPAASWTAEGSLAGALGGLGALAYDASSACEDPRCPDPGFCGLSFWAGSWSFVVPATATSVRMPLLPDELGCWLPIGTGSTVRSLAFVDVDDFGLTIDSDLFRRSSSVWFYSYFDRLRTRVLDAGAETRMTSYCSEASFCIPNETPDSPNPAQRISLGCYSPLELEPIACF